MSKLRSTLCPPRHRINRDTCGKFRRSDGDRSLVSGLRARPDRSGTEFLGAGDKAKFFGWAAEKKLAEDMAAAFYCPSVLRQIAADNSAEAAAAIKRIEAADADMAEEIRDLLEEG